MNEPHDMPTEAWVDDANASLAAIRAAGATNLVLVPGNAWDGAHAWTDNDYGTPNAVAMLSVVDPGDNYAFEVHQYLDANFSGDGPECVSTTIGSTSMVAFTGWLRDNGLRGFLGELGAPFTPICAAAIEDQLAYTEANSDVYLGWMWWSAGPWWGNYALSIEPQGGVDRPMMAVLAKHLGK
jgi:endoglucanase